MLSLSEQIRELVRNSEASALHIAKRAGISDSTLSRWLNNGTSINCETLDKLAKLFKVQITYQDLAGPFPKRGRKSQKA